MTLKDIFTAHLTLAAIIFFIPHESISAERLNVVMIVADDLNATLGCTGHSEVITPNLDKLAARGRLFNRAYCQQAVCNPSRASALTGLRPDTLKIWNLKTHLRDARPDVVTLPEHFKNNGYHAQGIGKIFHNFHTKIHGDPKSWSVPAKFHWGGHADDWVIPGKPFGTKPPRKGEPVQRIDVPDEAYLDGRIAQDAVETLGKLSQSERPFFLAVGFWKPHLPFNAPQKYWDLYDSSKLQPPANPQAPTKVPEQALHNWRELRNYRGMPKEGDLTPKQIAELRHGYLAAITFLDAQVGKVLRELDRLDLNDNTVIVFWSDHGFHLGEHGLWCKTSNFELDARVPLIISAPSMKQRGEKSDSIVELLDIYPTLSEMCGLPKPSHVEGVSLAPVVNNPKAAVKDFALTQHPRPAYYKNAPEVMGYSKRSPRFRETEWRDFKSGKVVAREKYDHKTDPLETHNLAEPIAQ